MRRITMLTALVAGLVLPGLAWADNTTSLGAYSLMVGGTPAEATASTTGPVERWYWTTLSQGRSYCAETQGGAHFDTGYGVDTILTVYRSNATTVIGSNDDVFSSEPGGNFLSRVCFVAPVTDGAFLKVSAAWGTFFFRVRIVETTLFSNWFFVGGDYGAYTLLRNTTGSLVNYTVNWRNAAGTVVKTLDSTLAANANAVINGAAFTQVVVAGSGSVEVAHNGSPDAIVASTTVLSITTGLSFDAPFLKRQPW